MIMICGTGMLPAIGFDNQSGFDANEVDNIGRDRKLTPKPPADLVLSKLPP
jgi:hypothetical protein